MSELIMREPKQVVGVCYWDYNVYKGDTPVGNLGKVVYVIDDFGTLVMVSYAQLGFSIQ